ncbi:hypothetical protein M422DRAFT_241163 [Sphaerobolus stellatus SS14]|nr:hypothetical protein M422DRAFT_241163 [Sphaerobolus stellatus SS14]
MNALREEIKETIFAAIKERLHSDADSITTVSHLMTTLDANAQYWSNLSNKVTCHSHRALELQLKMAEEKVNTLLYDEAPEEALLEAAREVHHICFQLDQNTWLCEAGLMSEQQVRFSADVGRNINSPSQDTPALLITAQLDGAVVNRTAEYIGIQQMVRQVIQNASHEAKSEKSYLAKAGVKMGNLPTYSGECNLERFESWIASVLQYMSMYNLLGPRAGKVQLQFLGQCSTDEAQQWFYWQVEQFDCKIKHWDLESMIMGFQKWFMQTLSLNKELSKLAKQMIELPDAYSYRRRFMDALKPDIKDQVLKKGFTPEFSKIDELVEQVVTFDNVKFYTSGYNTNHGSSYLHKTVIAEHSHAQHTTTQNKSSMNQNAGSSKQDKSGNNPVQNCQTIQSLLTGGGNVRVNPTYSKNPVKLGNMVNKPIQSNPVRTAAKANNTVVCFSCNQPGHIRPNFPFPNKDRRIAGARIEEVILEEDQGQIEESDKGTPHTEEQQDWEDQPEEDDQQYHFDDEEYELRSIDDEVVHVNAVIKASGYNDHCRLYGIRVPESEIDMRVSAVAQTEEKEQPVYDY